MARIWTSDPMEGLRTFTKGTRKNFNNFGKESTFSETSEPTCRVKDLDA